METILAGLIGGVATVLAAVIGLRWGTKFERQKNAPLRTFIPLTEIGVDAVYPDRGSHDDKRGDLFEKASHIRLHSIYANLGYRNLDGIVINALQAGKTVEFLIANPTSDYIRSNELQLALMGPDTAERINEDLSKFQEIEDLRRSGNWRGTLEVRTYTIQPSWSVYVYDDELFACPYLYRTEGGDTPCLYAREKMVSRSLYTQLSRHIDRIWIMASQRVIPDQP